ncbi:hypothetical protein BJ912DRAFT_1066096 [Pholiota molesta]|nr:hypothetical protein BJ912DRAFT_1066096 [Pholiota molesta]
MGRRSCRAGAHDRGVAAPPLRHHQHNRHLERHHLECECEFRRARYDDGLRATPRSQRRRRARVRRWRAAAAAGRRRRRRRWGRATRRRPSGMLRPPAPAPIKKYASRDSPLYIPVVCILTSNLYLLLLYALLAPINPAYYYAATATYLSA